ncbi:hypothetical protein D9M72_484820 [compost metagenome]
MFAAVVMKCRPGDGMRVAILQNEVTHNDVRCPAAAAFLLTNIRCAVQTQSHFPTLNDVVRVLPATGLTVEHLSQAGREAVLGGIGEPDRLLLAGEGSDRCDGPKDRLTLDHRIIGHVREDSGLVEVPGPGHWRAAGDDHRSSVDSGGDEAEQVPAAAMRRLPGSTQLSRVFPHSADSKVGGRRAGTRGGLTI